MKEKLAVYVDNNFNILENVRCSVCHGVVERIPAGYEWIDTNSKLIISSHYNKFHPDIYIEYDKKD